MSSITVSPQSQVNQISAPVAPAPKQLDTSVVPETGAAPSSAPQDLAAAKWENLARQQRVMRQRARQIEAREQALRVKETAAPSVDHSWKDRLKNDFYGTVTEAGLHPDEIATLLLNQPKPEDLRAKEIEKKLDAQAKANEDLRNQLQAQESQRFEQAKRTIHNDVKMMVDADPSFETIKATGMEEAVVELIVQTFNPETGYVMQNDEAAKQVEEYLAEEAFRLASLNKIQKRFAPQAPSAETAKQNPVKQPMQTLSNRGIPSSTTKPLSAAERRERAILAMKGQLT